MLAVSLTSIPPRLPRIGPTLASIQGQFPRPNRVLLCLPRRYRRFPGPVALPPLPDGVEVVWSDEDFGPATKALAAARALEGQGARLVYCDDDWIYGPGWLAALAEGPEEAVLAGAGFSVTALRRRADRPAAGETDIAQGFAGVAIRPEMLHGDAFDIPDAAWPVDDIWLSGHYARAGLAVRSRPAARAACAPRDLPGPELQDSHVNGLSRAQANDACARLIHRRYGIWPPR
ncbi:hypothetical protein [Rhodosalinus sp. FB01]|uniref:hypothetical protein n=1 Tax=Rhodosalinus sp. FB01 TaxID=3239194 RepID=UPI0035252A8A